MSHRILSAGSMLCACFIAANAFAAGVSGTLRYTNDTAMCWRGGAVMQQSNVVIAVVDVAGDGFEPPTTNAAHRYCGPGDEPSVNPTTPPALGYSQTDFKPGLVMRGGIDGLIEASEPLINLVALFRCFSALCVTQAAYYADGGSCVLKVIAPAVNDPGTWTNDTVNPAYAMLAFDTPPVSYGAGPSFCVSGSVSTVAGGSSNVLDNAIVMVYWRGTATDAWTAMQDVLITDNGDFTGVCAGVAVQVMVGLTNGPDALPNSLVAQGPVTLDLLPIAAARSRGEGAAIIVGPVAIATTNNLAASLYEFPVQDEGGMGEPAAGVMLTDPDPARLPGLIAAFGIKPDDRIVIAGTNAFSNGVYRLTGVAISTNLGPAAPVVARPIVFDDLQDGSVTAGLYESMLVVLDDAVFTNTGSFAAQAYRVTNNAGTEATIRIASATDPLVGMAIPGPACVVTGVLSQFDPVSPFDEGYELLPLGIVPVPEPVAAVVVCCALLIVRRRDNRHPIASALHP